MIVLADSGRVRGAMHRRYVLLAKKLSLILLLLLAAMSALAGGRSEDHAAAGSAAENGSIDYLGIAALMLKDELLDRAESALEHVDPADEGLDKARYYTIRGLLRLQSAHYADAASDLQSAVRHGQLDPLINVYLAQAYFGAENYSAVLEALDAVPDLTRFPGLWALKAHSLWSLRQTGAAFECLEQAIRLFPERHGILKQRIVYLLKLGLYQEAAAQSEEYLAKAGNDPEAFLAVGEALRRAGAVQEAVLILEMGALRFPNNVRNHHALSRAYVDQRRYLTAAAVLERAAALDPSYYGETVELYRLAGRIDRALFVTLLVPDPRQRCKKRFTLLLESGQYEQALAMESNLLQLGGLSDDVTLYAMAYACYKVQSYDRAIACLERISGSGLSAQIDRLRNAIEAERSSGPSLFNSQIYRIDTPGE